MKNTRNLEHGQIVVVLAIVFIAILGFAALAVDGGMIFSDRRAAQNGADAASMAGASAAGEYLNNYGRDPDDGIDPILNKNFSCSGPYINPAVTTAKNVAATSASSNNYTISKTSSTAESRVEVYCVDNGTDAPPYDKYLEVRVWITTQTDSNFAHLFYNGDLKSTVEAYTRLYPGFSAGLGQGIVSTCNNVKDPNKEGLIISGTANAKIVGSGAFSNCALNANGGGTIDASGGSINYFTTIDGPSTSFTPKPEKVDYKYVAPPTSSIVTTADCGPSQKDPNTGNKSHDTIQPGTYTSISQTGGVLTLTPGLYCITGKGGVTTTGGAIIGDGVTFFLLDGGLKIAGNMGVDKSGTTFYTDLKAPYSDADLDLRWFGYLVIMDDNNAPDNNPLKYSVDISGTAQTSFAGTIFAPNHNVKLTGTSDSTTPATFSTQVVGNTVTLGGTPLINVVFDASRAPYSEPSLDLHK